jgi:hypothetical protein
LGLLDRFLFLLCAVGMIFYLWRYFAFVGHDLDEIRPASSASVVWNMLLAIGFPLLCFLRPFSEEKNKTLVAIGMSAILVPAILPELQPPKASSALEWVYLRTVGKAIGDFAGSCVINLLLFVCWRFGALWVAVYAGVAIFFGMARSSWLLMQNVPNPALAAPTMRRLFMIFAAAFGWIAVVAFLVPLKDSREVHREVDELWKPYVWTTIIGWAFARFPRLAPLLRFGRIN